MYNNNNDDFLKLKSLWAEALKAQRNCIFADMECYSPRWNAWLCTIVVCILYYIMKPDHNVNVNLGKNYPTPERRQIAILL